MNGRRMPTENADVAAFNSRVRLVRLNQHWFLDIKGARAKVQAWRQDVNDVCRHGAIGNRDPMDPVNAEKSRSPTFQSVQVAGSRPASHADHCQPSYCDIALR